MKNILFMTILATVLSMVAACNLFEDDTITGNSFVGNRLDNSDTITGNTLVATKIYVDRFDTAYAAVFGTCGAVVDDTLNRVAPGTQIRVENTDSSESSPDRSAIYIANNCGGFNLASDLATPDRIRSVRAAPEDNIQITIFGLKDPIVPITVTALPKSPRIERVSNTPSGTNADGEGDSAAISGDGSIIAFVSSAKNIVDPPLKSSNRYVFMRNITSGVTTLVSSLTVDGVNDVSEDSNIAISDSGRFIYSVTERNQVLGLGELHMYDTGNLLQVMTLTLSNYFGNLNGYEFDFQRTSFDISANGLKIVYLAPSARSAISDPGDDVFIYDVSTDTTTLLTLGPAPSYDPKVNSPAISCNGSYVTFGSRFDWLQDPTDDGAADVYRWNAGALENMSNGLDVNYRAFSPLVTDTGAVVFLATPFNPIDSLNPAFFNVQLYIRNGATTSQLTNANGWINDIDMSCDGRFIVFTSNATDLVAGMEYRNGLKNVFVMDSLKGTVALVSQNKNGEISDVQNTSWETYDPRISSDGRYISFISLRGDLVQGDGDSNHDVFRVINPLY